MTSLRYELFVKWGRAGWRGAVSVFVEGKRTRTMLEVGSMPGRLRGGWGRGKKRRVEKKPSDRSKIIIKRRKKGQARK